MQWRVPIILTIGEHKAEISLGLCQYNKKVQEYSLVVEHSQAQSSVPQKIFTNNRISGIEKHVNVST